MIIKTNYKIQVNLLIYGLQSWAYNKYRTGVSLILNVLSWNPNQCIKTQRLVDTKGRCQKHPEGGAAKILGGVRTDFNNFRGGSHQYQQF